MSFGLHACLLGVCPREQCGLIWMDTSSSPRHDDVPVMWRRTKVNGAIAARKGPALAPLDRKTEDQIRARRVVERPDADVVLPGSKYAGGAEHDDGDVKQISRDVEAV